MPDQINLQICQDCGKNPAVYGDGLTWSRCSSCQLQKSQKEGKNQADHQDPVGEQPAIEHKILPGITSIIMPVYMINYALFHYTGNAIGSIREHTKKGTYEFIVVDNASPMQPPSLQSYYADKVIQNSENLGVTKAWNQGIRISQGEYIVLINNDVQVFDHWLPDMKEAIDKRGIDLVMAHPMYSNTEPFSRAEESGKIRDSILEKFLNISLEFKDTASYQQEMEKAFFSTFRDFSCVMFKRSLIDEIGLFDEQFKVYCSDSDFIKRMEVKGKKWACLETVATSHLSDATGMAMKDERQKIADEDRALYDKKWKEIINLPKGSEFIRVEDGGDPIYFKKDENVYHITDPETLKALGGDFGMERIVTTEEFNKYKQQEDISLDNYKKYV